MAIYKQGQLNQVLFVAVDKTDFATVESGVTSNFTVTLFGVKQGSSAAASATTISRVPSVVNSGVLIQTLEAADTSGLDNAILNIKHASCADQNIPINFQIQDLSGAISDVDSQVLLNASMISDTLSALDSQFLIYQSDISQVDSEVGAMASQLLLVKSNLSDVESQVDLNASMISDTQSAIDSQFLVYQSDISDIDSQLLVIQSMASDAHSAALDAGAGTVTDSDISDIVSAIWATNPSTISATASTMGSLFVKSLDDGTLSDITSKATALASQLLLVKSNLSDVESQVDLNASNISDTQSALDSQFLVYQSDISQLDSAVDAGASQLLLVKSNVSDVESQVDLNASVISDVQSALDSQFLVYQSDISDVYSAVGGTVAEMAKSTAPPASPTIKQILNHIYRMHRNTVLTTASDIILQNDAANSTITTATISDDGTTFTKGEFS